VRNALALAVSACLLAALPAPAAASKADGSLYSGPKPRPGPPLLYAKPPKRAPQMRNRGPWKANPILVSGASAYRKGEFIYQDFLYDDHGATAQPDPTDPRAGADTFSRPNGTYTYPTDRAYVGNLADLVEFRVRPLKRATAFRLTFNSMTDPELMAATLAIAGPGARERPVPFGANATAAARRFLTWHGGSATLSRANGRPGPGPIPRVKVHEKRRQVTIRVSKRTWNPRKRKVHFALGTGLWDTDADRYLTPGRVASASEPGGGRRGAPAFFNLAFRYDEPLPDPTKPAQTAASPAWWRDAAQGEALAAGDLTAFTQKVDFAKLRRGVRDNSNVPRSGPISRILQSRFEPGQGTDYSVRCVLGDRARCPGSYQGNLQPYALFVPHRKPPRRGFGFQLQLHALATNYNLYQGSNNQRQFAARAQGFLTATPQSRGPDGFYANLALADTFEVWADVARRYDVDPASTAIGGYSMGGIGSFKIAAMYPDLFAAAQPVVGYAEDNGMLASLRNVPVLMWNGLGDELVGPALFQPTADALDDAGYRYELDVFHPGEHLSLAINDEYGPAAEFLGRSRVDRNPAHVTFVRNRALEHPNLGLVADRAYWVSKVRFAGPGKATVDVRSLGFGAGEPPVSPTRRGAGALPGGAFLDPYPYTSQSRSWGRAPERPAENKLLVEATNVASLRINPKRAKVGCDAEVEISSKTPTTVRLAGCGRKVEG
jgi:hypothetical protein